eukprot:CAMPEP_0116944082 /NCGR_PEP_ID=MMETSP0467-20121206/35582_1 /TAXON_ID=283647 /ORGANISM="Mesodinium pulex, Strain SPMC105" /LENGTH=92 /DNA_ID=CAMNT_0004627409 /DNA_START=216 /DNA_END=494 /DNA_ORIENTATION=+
MNLMEHMACNATANPTKIEQKRGADRQKNLLLLQESKPGDKSSFKSYRNFRENSLNSSKIVKGSTLNINNVSAKSDTLKVDDILNNNNTTHS